MDYDKATWIPMKLNDITKGLVSTQGRLHELNILNLNFDVWDE